MDHADDVDRINISMNILDEWDLKAAHTFLGDLDDAWTWEGQPLAVVNVT